MGFVQNMLADALLVAELVVQEDNSRRDAGHAGPEGDWQMTNERTLLPCCLANNH